MNPLVAIVIGLAMFMAGSLSGRSIGDMVMERNCGKTGMHRVMGGNVYQCKKVEKK